MKTLKVETFFGFKPYNDLVEFVNKNNIKKDDILKIAHSDNGRYTLFYYSETA